MVASLRCSFKDIILGIIAKFGVGVGVGNAIEFAGLHRTIDYGTADDRLHMFIEGRAYGHDCPG